MDVQPTSLADVKAIDEPFDFVCWDLYARVGQWYAEDPARDRVRRETLHALETGPASAPRWAG